MTDEIPPADAITDGAPQGTVPAVVDGSRLEVVDPAVREEVFFDSAGLRLAGHLYRPPSAPDTGWRSRPWTAGSRRPR